jgi:AraC-like DNA-binding protein
MKILQTEITPSLNSYISLLERDDSFFRSPFHYHPELELVYVKESYGKRIIGDKIEPFEAGDMVFIGSNLPHVWLNDEIFYSGISNLRARSIVLYFNKDVLGPVFYDMQEAAKVNEFFQKASRGLRIENKTRTIVADKLEKMLSKKGFDKIIALFDILNILSHSKDISFITSDGYSPQLKNPEADRLAEVYRYVQNNFKEDVDLTKVAGIANLTPQSFCRLFKKRTNKHFVEYLNEIRISNACKYLLDTDWSISEVAYACGYKTVSNFNKLFKEITGCSPKAYRQKLMLSLQDHKQRKKP